MPCIYLVSHPRVLVSVYLGMRCQKGKLGDGFQPGFMYLWYVMVMEDVSMFGRPCHCARGDNVIVRG